MVQIKGLFINLIKEKNIIYSIPISAILFRTNKENDSDRMKNTFIEDIFITIIETYI
jgi:hypothetical protein